MTSLKNTVQTILQEISDLRGESSVNTTAFRIRAVSRAEKDFARRMLWRIFLLRDQTMVGDATNDYEVGDSDYPYRIKGLSELYVATTGSDNMTLTRYAIVDFHKYKSLYSSNSAGKMVYEWYDAANDVWKLHINPAPAATETITYSYFWQPPTRTLVTDAIICPNQMIISYLALADIYDSEDDPKNTVYKNLAEQMIAELVGKENSPAVNQAYSMGAIENMNGGGGIGTY